MQINILYITFIIIIVILLFLFLGINVFSNKRKIKELLMEHKEKYKKNKEKYKLLNSTVTQKEILIEELINEIEIINTIELEKQKNDISILYEKLAKLENKIMDI